MAGFHWARTSGEDISPFKTFYAAVVRKDAKDGRMVDYQVENALTREGALRGYDDLGCQVKFLKNMKGAAWKKVNWPILSLPIKTTTKANPNCFQ